MPPKVTINEVYALLMNFIQERAVTKDDIKGLAKAEDLIAVETKITQKVDALQESLEKNTRTLDKNIADTVESKGRVTTLEETVAEMKVMKAEMKVNEIKRQMHDRRKNLLVCGKPENTNETKRDCRDYIRTLLIDMQVPDAENLIIVDAHRLGKGNPATIRPIVFSVTDTFVVKDITDQLSELRKLRDYDNVYFRKHLPKSMLDQRKKLKRKMQELYNSGMKPRWQINFETYESYIKDKNGKTYLIPKE